ncbi:NUDIX hydrolase [Legionella impletisoli]|uniref:Coenzyme A pyrophosphatase n=1 Tax=Legionella impletisoli TaxID=343510 RepID=A0A917JLZ5_9GAMM|nr:CoA pyrophosphatase [Legionella impletisoli]GGI76121.1 coenzyme A pyrophosphatase [Legionella impletisoli]
MTRESAVILLHELKTDSLILTKRNESLRNHPGEFCFPGGMRDLKDQDLWSTALREVHEELGIDSSRIACVKALKPEYTLLGKIIYPWLATISALQPYVMNKHEVSDVISLPMKEVSCRNNYKELCIEKANKKIITCQYTAYPHLVWGATARIMQQLCLDKKE